MDKLLLMVVERREIKGASHSLGFVSHQASALLGMRRGAFMKNSAELANSVFAFYF